MLGFMQGAMTFPSLALAPVSPGAGARLLPLLLLRP
jgi:hypothetical protein